MHPSTYLHFAWLAMRRAGRCAVKALDWPVCWRAHCAYHTTWRLRAMHARHAAGWLATATRDCYRAARAARAYYRLWRALRPVTRAEVVRHMRRTTRLSVSHL